MKRIPWFFFLALFFFLGLVIAGMFLSFSYLWPVLLVFGALVLITLLSYKLEWGLYSMCLFLPLINWNFTLGSLSLSFIEVVSLLALAGLFLRLLLDFWREGKSSLKRIEWPLWKPFLFFFLALLLSSLLNQYIFFSAWYAVRWILFFYLAYVFYPFNVIKNGEILKRALFILVISGLLVAGMGVYSLFIQDWYNDFFRVQPIAMFGIYPLGSNHNLLAEFLVIITFFILSLKHWFKTSRARRLIDVLFLALLAVTIGTFSRTGWLVLGLEVSLYLIFEYFILKRLVFKWRDALLAVSILLLVLIPFVLRMDKLQASNVSSTENRLLLSQIAWRAFLQEPVWGHGPGMFVNLVEDNIRFGAKYGDPLDSHGVMQKVIAETGALGVISFVYLLYSIFYKMYLAIKRYPQYHVLLLPLAIGSLGGLVYQFFNTSYYKGKLWLPISLALIAITLLDKKYVREKKS